MTVHDVLRIVVRSGRPSRRRRASRARVVALHAAQRFAVLCDVMSAVPVAADALRIAVQADGSLRRRRAPRACAVAPHLARSAAARLERAWPAASAAFVGALAARLDATRGREGRGRLRAEGKIKGRGTVWRERLVCTWGRRGTRREAAACRRGARRLALREPARRAPPAMPTCAGDAA